MVLPSDAVQFIQPPDASQNEDSISTLAARDQTLPLH
jgi:hypothetical protein